MGKPLNQSSVYSATANNELLSHLRGHVFHSVLDIGAGTGANLLAIRSAFPHCQLSAITCSEMERTCLTEAGIKDSHCLDLNSIDTLSGSTAAPWQPDSLDLIILCNVLEHLIDPQRSLAAVSKWVRPNGLLLIAVPNICNWRTRYAIAMGRFEYQNGGIMDRTHLRFYTFWSARNNFAAVLPDFKLLYHGSSGAAILGPFRRIAGKSLLKAIDNLATRKWPNLFGGETHLLFRKKESK